jgi:hypothetical protein
MIDISEQEFMKFAVELANQEYSGRLDNLMMAMQLRVYAAHARAKKLAIDMTYEQYVYETIGFMEA